MKKILVIGSANMDFVVGVDHIPELGETILSRSFHQSPGGKGANQAFACGRLGCPVAFLGALGRDGMGDILESNLRSAGVDVSAVKRAENVSTGLAVVTVDSKGDNAITVIPGANSCCDTEYLRANRRLLEECDMILMQMEIPYESIAYAVKLGAELGKTVILDPAPAPDSLPDEIYSRLDYLTPNETEFKRLTGCPTEELEDILSYGGRLLEKGVKNLLVTLGGRGAVLLRKEGHRLFTPPKVKVVDTTAAGDTFNAAFLRKLAEGAAPEAAAEFACCAGALAVSRSGAQSAIPSYEETAAFQKGL